MTDTPTTQDDVLDSIVQPTSNRIAIMIVLSILALAVAALLPAHDEDSTFLNEVKKEFSQLTGAYKASR